MQRPYGNRTILLGVLCALVLCLPGTSAAGPEARAALPTPAELAKLELLRGWKRPWEMKDMKEGDLEYEAFPSEAAYYAENEFDTAAQEKQSSIEEIQGIPEEALGEVKQMFAAQLQQGVTPFPGFLAPDERIRTEIADLLRKNKFTKAALVSAFRKQLDPLKDATEIVYTKFSQPPSAKEGARPVRAATVRIRVFIYDPAHAKKHPEFFVVKAEQVADMEKKARDFFKNVRKLLGEKVGENLEDDLEELLAKENPTDHDSRRIEELTEALDALDTLDRYPHKVSTSMPEVGDQCVELRTLNTFPANKRATLAKANAQLGTMVNTYVRQGAAIAHLSLTTNDNSLWNAKQWNALVQLLAEKLRKYRVP